MTEREYAAMQQLEAVQAAIKCVWGITPESLETEREQALLRTAMSSLQLLAINIKEKVVIK